MAAGLGFKTFTTGEVLTASDVNGYLMQGILVFATEAARNSAITSPQEGQFAFTKDTNSLWYYTGSAWAASGATGDIEGVTAGVGISGGGTSGTVTVTNSMATAIDAKGDLVPGTGADTFARLAVGADGTVLTADSTAATGLKWATSAGGGKVLQVVSATKTDTFTTTSSSMVDVTDLSVSITPTANTSKILVIYDVQIYGKIGTFFGAMNLVRGSTAIKIGTGSTGSRAAVTQIGFDFGQAYAGVPSGSGNYLDSPATTSATTYKIQVQRIGGTGSDIVCINRSNTDDDASGRPRTASTITVMEIGA